MKEGRQLPFSAALLTEKFNDKGGDDLYLWARDRSQSLSTASMSSARSLNSSMARIRAYGTGYRCGPWNTGTAAGISILTSICIHFVPGSGGTFLNAFGYGFFSPGTIYNYYTPDHLLVRGGGAPGTGTIGRPLSRSRQSDLTAGAAVHACAAGTSAASSGECRHSVRQPLAVESRLAAGTPQRCTADCGQPCKSFHRRRCSAAGLRWRRRGAGRARWRWLLGRWRRWWPWRRMSAGGGARGG